jgi:hypothetical protein
MLLKTPSAGYPALNNKKLQLNIRTYTQKTAKLQDITELAGMILASVCTKFYGFMAFPLSDPLFIGGMAVK